MKILVVIIIAVAGYVAFTMLSRADIDSAEAHALVEAGATLIDVRTPDEFAAGHIEGAINVPVDQVRARVDELGPRSEPIVVYCRSGARSRRAQSELTSAGFTNVRNLGPMSAW